MPVLIIGSKGNMGRRYKAILDSLLISSIGIDVGDDLEKAMQNASSAIVATPTNTHYDVLQKLAFLKKPVLCEKPISTNLNEVYDIVAMFARSKTRLSMVWQYKMLLQSGQEGESSYNYFNHGKDGLYWDCIQIIGLAKGPVYLSEKSPYWHCRINGQLLDIGDMDSAYAQFIDSWLEDPQDDLTEILKVHQKVQKLMEKHNGSH